MSASAALSFPTDNFTAEHLRNATVYRGGCHCQAVRFEVIVPNDKHDLLDCNCSICNKKGFLHLIATPQQFRLLSGQDSITLYTFQTHTAKHMFCKVCGIHSFYRPRSHPNDFSIDGRCLDDWNQISSKFKITQYDGENWEAAKKALDATDAATEQ